MFSSKLYQLKRECEETKRIWMWQRGILSGNLIAIYNHKPPKPQSVRRLQLSVTPVNLAQLGLRRKPEN